MTITPEPTDSQPVPSPGGPSAEQGAVIDRHGDVWTPGSDGLMHTPETRPFPLAHVEKKWGPLRPVTPL